MVDSTPAEKIKSDTPGIIAPPPLIYAAGLAGGLLFHAALPLHVPSSTFAAVLGLCLIGTGVLLAAAGFRAMSRVGTHVDPFKPTTALATDGPFRFTRNPLYLSLTLLYGGIALFANLPWAILFLPIVLLIMRRGVINREERYLEQKFGEAYLRYKRNVRRWF